MHTPQVQRVVELGQQWCANDLLPGLAWGIVAPGKLSEVVCAGWQRTAGPPVEPDTQFLVASLTKPIVAMGLLLLCERGLLSLNDRVVDWLPEFRDAAKRAVTLRHLLTHTSGLPDQLPDNHALRQAHAPLSAFVAGACAVPLEFVPGRAVRYQSMGYALLGEIMERVTGTALSEFLRESIFEPLGMRATLLGGAAAAQAPVAEIRVPADQQEGPAWNWNSPYWRELGAPWGGLISTVEDLCRFCHCLLVEGAGPLGRVFSPATVQLAIGNRLEEFPELGAAERRTRAWGYGWRHNWLDHRSVFSDLLPPNAVGHWGAVGTLFWLDFASRRAAVLLSTLPVERQASPLTRLSNAILANWEAG